MSLTTEMSSTITAGVSVATMLGGLISFVWARFEIANRRTRADLNHALQELKKCEARSAEVQKMAQTHRAAMTTVIELMWQELSRIAPAGAVLRRVGRLLDGIRRDDMPLPEEDKP